MERDLITNDSEIKQEKLQYLFNTFSVLLLVAFLLWCDLHWHTSSVFPGYL